MPLGQSQDIPQTDPRGMATPRFWHRLIRFRHVISGSLALASLNHTCRNLVPTFPQRSPPSLLTTAACGGLRSTPDCRPRRALLHLSYSYASPCGPALLVTQDPNRTLSRRCDRRRKSESDHLNNFRRAPSVEIVVAKLILSSLAEAAMKPRYSVLAAISFGLFGADFAFQPPADAVEVELKPVATAPPAKGKG